MTSAPILLPESDAAPVRGVRAGRVEIRGDTNTLSNNAGRRPPPSTTVRDLSEHDLGGRVSIAEVVSFHARTRAAKLDLRLKAARVLIESAAIVMARNDGVRAVLNLDKAFDRALGGD